MLTAAERSEIEALLDRYALKRAAGPEALSIVQRHRGWIPDDAVHSVATLLDLTPEELESIGTSYSHLYQKPVGRHVILLCDSVTCWIMGCTTLLDHLRRRLGIGVGETTPDGAFTLLPSACLGCCDHAPALMVDEDLHVDLTPERLDALLDAYKDAGRPRPGMVEED